jgi:hypothetical protein
MVAPKVGAARQASAEHLAELLIVFRPLRSRPCGTAPRSPEPVTPCRHSPLETWERRGDGRQAMIPWLSTFGARAGAGGYIVAECASSRMGGVCIRSSRASACSTSSRREGSPPSSGASSAVASIRRASQSQRVRISRFSSGVSSGCVVYSVHARIRKSLGEMTRKLSDTASQ